MVKIIFRPAAEQELEEAFRWYEEHEPGLGNEFLRCVEDRTKMIQRHPEAFPVVRKRVRQGSLRRFPYSILYFIAAGEIVVISVFHSSRDPKIWHGRA